DLRPRGTFRTTPAKETPPVCYQASQIEKFEVALVTHPPGSPEGQELTHENVPLLERYTLSHRLFGVTELSKIYTCPTGKTPGEPSGGKNQKNCLTLWGYHVFGGWVFFVECQKKIEKRVV